MKFLRRISPEIAVFTFGLLLFSVGLGLAWLPLGLIGPGIVLMALPLFGGDRLQ